jgi:hypothetical protein
MQVVEQMEMGKVIFETDCLNLKLELTSSNYFLSSIGNLISHEVPTLDELYKG